MEIKNVIGRKSEPKSIVVECGQMRLFAKATGVTDPSYVDIEAAKASGYRGLLALPTFLFSLDLLCQGDTPSILEELNIPIGNVLHGGERFKYGAPIYSGDEIIFTSEVTDAYEKKGGALKFIVNEVNATNQLAEFVGKMVHTTVVRG